MKISAIIPAFNAEKYLERAVLSLIDTKHPNLEIVIVDDGSTDSTWNLAQSLVFRHSEVHLFSHPDRQNHGVSASRNLGLLECTGELICFLDADDYVLPHRFELAVSILESRPEVDGVHELAVMEFESERGKERFWDENDMFGIRATNESAGTIDLLLRGSCWPTSGILFRRKLLEKTGLFPEHYRFAEDYHLWLRMACVSAIVPGNTSKPVSVYFRHGNNTYQGGLERKDDIIRAMTDVYQWLRNNPDGQVERAVFAKPVCDYIRNALIRAREEKRFDIGREILNTVLKQRFFSVLGDFGAVRQILAIVFREEAPSFQ